MSEESKQFTCFNGVIKEINWHFGAKIVTVKTGHNFKGLSAFKKYSKGNDQCLTLL